MKVYLTFFVFIITSGVVMAQVEINKDSTRIINILDGANLEGLQNFKKLFIHPPSKKLNNGLNAAIAYRNDMPEVMDDMPEYYFSGKIINRKKTGRWYFYEDDPSGSYHPLNRLKGVLNTEKSLFEGYKIIENEIEKYDSLYDGYDYQIEYDTLYKTIGKIEGSELQGNWEFYTKNHLDSIYRYKNGVLISIQYFNSENKKNPIFKIAKSNYTVALVTDSILTIAFPHAIIKYNKNKISSIKVAIYFNKDSIKTYSKKEIKEFENFLNIPNAKIGDTITKVIRQIDKKSQLVSIGIKSEYDEFIELKRGVLKNGKKEGKWIDLDGYSDTIKIAYYTKNILNGPFQEGAKYGSQSNLIKGNYNKGKKSGTWVHNGQIGHWGTYQDSILVETIVKGVLDGFYSKKNCVRGDEIKTTSGFYEKGLKTGEWTEYEENFYEKHTGTYQNGKKNGDWIIERTQTFDLCSFENDSFDGEYKRFWKSDSSIAISAHFTQNKLDRTYKVWNPDGVLLMDESWKISPDGKGSFRVDTSYYYSPLDKVGRIGGSIVGRLERVLIYKEDSTYQVLEYKNQWYNEKENGKWSSHDTNYVASTGQATSSLYKLDLKYPFSRKDEYYTRFSDNLIKKGNWEYFDHKGFREYTREFKNGRVESKDENQNDKKDRVWSEYDLSTNEYDRKVNTNKLEYGEFEVGYKDTIVYDTTEAFQYNSVEIAKPYFIHIWYPTLNSSKSQKLKYENYWQFDADSTETSLIQKIRELYNIEAFDSNETPKVIQNQNLVVFDSPPVAKNNLEVILYHHGSQGVGIENYKICEYLASHGYTVIAPNFTLPSDMVPKLIPSTEFKNKYNLRNLTPEVMDSIQLDMNNAELNNLDFILEFAKNSFKKKIIGIGHSRGAQRLLLSDKDSINRLKKIILFHTTYEDLLIEEICEMHPFDCKIMDKSANCFDTPKFFFAQKHYSDSVLSAPNFDFYGRFTNSTYCQINPPIEHNAYVYDWLIYNLHKKTIPESRIEIYNQILKSCLIIIQENTLLSNKSITITKTK